MLSSSRKTLTAIATVSALAAGGAARAGAAVNSSSSSSAQERMRGHGTGRRHGRQGQGRRAREGARGTVVRAEEGGPYSTKYHAHVRRSDGSEVVVLVNASFEATAVEAFTRP